MGFDGWVLSVVSGSWQVKGTGELWVSAEFLGKALDTKNTHLQSELSAGVVVFGALGCDCG
jgi:hypothetical protein